MEFSVDKKEQYVILTAQGTDLDAASATTLEKQIIQLYASDKVINYILDFDETTSIAEEGLTLLKKINALCQRESGLLVTVSTNDDVLDALDGARIEKMVSLLSVEEAIDAIFMNELENDFLGDEMDDDHGFESIEGEDV
ncbi:MAG: STAS domain-containing protein [Spirosomataceae bacterium]